MYFDEHGIVITMSFSKINLLDKIQRLLHL